MPVSWIENPRVRGSIPRLATTELNQIAHSSEWAFCYLAFAMGWRAILEIFDAGSARRSSHRLPMAIRQGCLCGHHQVDPMGAGCSLCLRGSGCRIVLRGPATTDRWWGCPVGVRGLYDQGRRGGVEG